MNNNKKIGINYSNLPAEYFVLQWRLTNKYNERKQKKVRTSTLKNVWTLKGFLTEGKEEAGVNHVFISEFIAIFLLNGLLSMPSVFLKVEVDSYKWSQMFTRRKKIYRHWYLLFLLTIGWSNLHIVFSWMHFI